MLRSGFEPAILAFRRSEIVLIVDRTAVHYLMISKYITFQNNSEEWNERETVET
jgi:hypothetical protein